MRKFGLQNLNSAYRSAARVAMCFALIFALSVPVSLMSPVVCHATTQEEKDRLDELKKKQSEASSNRAGQKKTLDKLKKEAAEAKKNVNNLNRNINQVKKEATEAENGVLQASRDIETLSQELAQAAENEQKQYKALKTQLAYMYENSLTQNMITILFSSKSISDFITRSEYALQIAKYDHELLKSYQEIQETIKNKSASLKLKQQELTAYQEILSAKNEELNGKLKDANAELSEKAEAVNIQQANLDEIEKDIKGYKAETAAIQQRVAEAQAAQAEKAAQEAAAQRAAAEAEAKRLREEAERKKQEAAQDPTNEQKKKEAEEAERKAQEAERVAAEASTIPSTEGRVYSNQSELSVLAAIVQSEAGNQGYAGQLAVASVIMNRVYTRGYGFANANTITAVVYQKSVSKNGKVTYQFEPCVRKMTVKQNGHYVELNMTVIEYYVSHPEAISATSRQAAQDAINGVRYHGPNGSMNQLFFMTPAAFEKQAWLKGRNIKDKFTLGGHTFFNVL